MVRERLVKVIHNLAPTPIAWTAIVVGVFVHFVGLFLFKVEVPSIAHLEEKDAYLSFVSLDESSGNSDLRERALLSDSMPLFLPSKYDYSWNVYQPNQYVEDRNATMLAPIEHEFGVEAESVFRNPFDPEKVPSLKGLLASDNWDVYETLGEKRIEPLVLEQRFGMFEFLLEATGERVEQIPVKEASIMDDVLDVFWKPCFVLVHVGLEGSIGKPRLLESSGLVSIDQWVLRQVERYGNQGVVSPGYYRVIFGP